VVDKKDACNEIKLHSSGASVETVHCGWLPAVPGSEPPLGRQTANAALGTCREQARSVVSQLAAFRGTFVLESIGTGGIFLG